MKIDAARTTTTGDSMVATETATRVTPSDGPTFREVMQGSARSLLRGATAAVRTLPVGPLMAASVRPGGPSAEAQQSAVHRSGLAPKGPERALILWLALQIRPPRGRPSSRRSSKVRK